MSTLARRYFNKHFKNTIRDAQTILDTIERDVEIIFSTIEKDAQKYGHLYDLEDDYSKERHTLVFNDKSKLSYDSYNIVRINDKIVHSIYH